MSLSIEFKHFVITEMVYKTIADGIECANSENEEIDQTAQGRLAIHKELENCIFEFVTDVKTSFNGSPYRILELSVQFHFDLIFEKEEEKEDAIAKIKDEFSGPLLDFCKNQIRGIIRQVTSIDYQPPINSGTLVFQIS